MENKNLYQHLVVIRYVLNALNNYIKMVIINNVQSVDKQDGLFHHLVINLDIFI